MIKKIEGGVTAAKGFFGSWCKCWYQTEQKRYGDGIQRGAMSDLRGNLYHKSGEGSPSEMGSESSERVSFFSGCCGK